MNERYITLLGAEQVQHAANTMLAAASDMIRAANFMDDIMRRHKDFMDIWLVRLEEVMKEKSDAQRPPL